VLSPEQTVPYNGTERTGKQVARQKDTGRFSQESVKLFLKQSQATTVSDVQEALKELFGATLQAMLEGEMDNHLGYEKSDAQSRQTIGTINRRNGHGSKNVRSDYGDIALTVPRDREGSFEPLIVQKRQKNVTGIEGA